MYHYHDLDDDLRPIMNMEYMTELDKAVLSNDYDRVCDVLGRGGTIYFQQKLCNGYMTRKYRTHDKCIMRICYKNAVYYAFYMFACFVKRIGYILSYLPQYDEYGETVISLRTIYDNIACDCKVLYEQYANLYDHNYNNTETIQTLLTDKLDHITNILKQHNQNYTININLISDLMDQTCYHAKYNINNLIKHDDYAIMFINLVENYKINNTIRTLLINQQCYEYYRHFLYRNLDDMTTITDIVRRSMYDINYLTPSNLKSIFTTTIEYNDNYDLINYLLKSGCIIPIKLNELINTTIGASFYGNTKALIQIGDDTNLLEPYNLTMIILTNKQFTNDNKKDLLNLLYQKNSLTVSREIITEVLLNDLSYGILEIFIRHRDFDNNIDQLHITTCIRSLKFNELNLILQTCRKSLINGEDVNETPILMYFHCTKTDNDKTIKVLNVLCKYSPELNIADPSGDTPLIIAIKQNRYHTFDILMNKGANPFMKDITNRNALHNAILYARYDMIEKLQNIVKTGSYLINEPDRYEQTSLSYALNTDEPIKTISTLIRSPHLNINHVDSHNNNIMNLIIEHQKLSNDIKYELFKILINYDIDLTNISAHDNKPLVLKALDYDLPDIAVIILNKLINQGEIDIGYSDVLVALQDQKNDKTKRINIKVRDMNKPNYYGLVISQLRNRLNLQKYAITPNQAQDRHIFITTTADKDIISANSVFDPTTFAPLLYQRTMIILYIITLIIMQTH